MSIADLLIGIGVGSLITFAIIESINKKILQWQRETIVSQTETIRRLINERAEQGEQWKAAIPLKVEPARWHAE